MYPSFQQQNKRNTITDFKQSTVNHIINLMHQPNTKLMPIPLAMSRTRSPLPAGILSSRHAIDQVIRQIQSTAGTFPWLGAAMLVIRERYPSIPSGKWKCGHYHPRVAGIHAERSKSSMQEACISSK
jgi:hypothetical protein